MIHDHLTIAGSEFHFVDADGRLAAGIFGTVDDLAAVFGQLPPPGISRHRGPLQAYAGGDLSALNGIDVEQSGTPFFQRVWAALRQIAPGATVTYGELAATLETGPRAVASACARNTVALVIPCHRVVGAGGAISGYRWGVDTKRALLAFEAGHGLA